MDKKQFFQRDLKKCFSTNMGKRQFFQSYFKKNENKGNSELGGIQKLRRVVVGHE